MELTFWQLMALAAVPGGSVLVSVCIGGWLVFRTKNAQLGIPMIPSKPKKGEVDRYVDLTEFDIYDEVEKELSPAAKRLRKQRGDVPLKDVLKHVKGEKVA